MTTTPPTTLPAETLLVTVPRAAKMLSLSPRSIYVLVSRGDLRLRHVGRASRIHIDDLRAYADTLGSAAAEKAVRP